MTTPDPNQEVRRLIRTIDERILYWKRLQSATGCASIGLYGFQLYLLTQYPHHWLIWPSTGFQTAMFLWMMRQVVSCQRHMRLLWRSRVAAINVLHASCPAMRACSWQAVEQSVDEFVGYRG